MAELCLRSTNGVSNVKIKRNPVHLVYFVSILPASGTHSTQRLVRIIGVIDYFATVYIRCHAAHTVRITYNERMRSRH